MDAKTFSVKLREILEYHLPMDEGSYTIQSYEEKGMLTKDEGLIIRFRRSHRPWDEFQVTIVKSK